MKGMHLLPSYYTTTSTKRRKVGKKSKSLLKAEEEHKKFLKKMGVGTSKPKRAAVAQSVEHLICNQRVEGSNPSGGTITTWAPCVKKPEKVYTGTEIIGIGQMHKSNAVPIRRKEDAKSIANMRR
jgi:hypothetical protein